MNIAPQEADQAVKAAVKVTEEDKPVRLMLRPQNLNESGFLDKMAETGRATVKWDDHEGERVLVIEPFKTPKPRT